MGITEYGAERLLRTVREGINYSIIDQNALKVKRSDKKSYFAREAGREAPAVFIR